MAKKSPEQKEAERLRYIAASAASTPDEFEPFFTDPNQAIRNAAALNPDADADVLDRFARDRFWSTRHAVAEHPNTELRTLAFLVSEPPAKRGVVYHAARERLERDGRTFDADGVLIDGIRPAAAPD